ncbi:MAG: hypothetical protein ACRD0W_22280, partial [Acidimicrobiales bacterium]
AVKALLDAAEKDFDRVRVIDDDLHPWLAGAAIGAERFVKLVLGFALLDRDGRRPGDEIVKAGHKIMVIEARCRDIVSAQVGRATQPKFIRSLLSDIDADPWMAPLLEVLECFADQGRYEHADVVAGRAPKNTPTAQFEALELDIAKTHPALPHGELDQHLRHLHAVVRVSLRRWRNFYACAMAHG